MMLPFFRSSRSQMFCKIDDLKDFAKTQKTSVPESYLNKVAGLQKHCTKMKFSIKDFFSKCNQIRNFMRIWSHLLKKSLMENFFFCVVKETPVQMFSSIFLKIFKNTYFIEHLRASAFAFWRSNNQSQCKKVVHYKNVFLDTTKIYIY